VHNFIINLEERYYFGTRFVKFIFPPFLEVYVDVLSITTNRVLTFSVLWFFLLVVVSPFIVQLIGISLQCVHLRIDVVVVVKMVKLDPCLPECRKFRRPGIATLDSGLPERVQSLSGCSTPSPQVGVVVAVDVGTVVEIVVAALGHLAEVCKAAEEVQCFSILDKRGLVWSEKILK